MVGRVVLIVVAIDAMVVLFFVLAIVLVDDVLSEIGQVALIESELTVEFITRFDESIAEETVDRLFGYMPTQGLWMNPSRRTMSVDVNVNVRLGNSRGK